MYFHDYTTFSRPNFFSRNLRRVTCLFSYQLPGCWESYIKWFYNKVLLIPGFPYHRSLLQGEILKNSKLFSSIDFNVHPFIHTKQEMQQKSVNESYYYLQPALEKLLHFIEQRRLCQKPCENIKQDSLIHTSDRDIGEFDHSWKKKVHDQEPPAPEQSQNRNIEDTKHEPPETSANMKQLDDVQPGGSNPEKLSMKPIQRSSVSIFSAKKDNEYFRRASTDTVVKNRELVKSESAETSKARTAVSSHPSTTTVHPLDCQLPEDNEYFRRASTDTVVKNRELVKLESAETSKERTVVSSHPSTTTVHPLDCQLPEGIERSHHASTDTVIKKKELVKSEFAGTSKERTAMSPYPSITGVHSQESHLSEEKAPSISENEESNTTSLRDMFPDLKISDENLSLKRLQQMSTTDITKEIVSLNKPAILKPTVRLIPQNKMWLSPLEEVDKQQEAEAEKEIVQWERTPSNQETDSESEEETELTIDLEDDGNSKETK